MSLIVLEAGTQAAEILAACQQVSQQAAQIQVVLDLAVQTREVPAAGSLADHPEVRIQEVHHTQPCWAVAVRADQQVPEEAECSVVLVCPSAPALAWALVHTVTAAVVPQIQQAYHPYPSHYSRP